MPEAGDEEGVVLGFAVIEPSHIQSSVLLQPLDSQRN